MKSARTLIAALALALVAPAAIAQSSTTHKAHMKDIVQVAVDAGSFNTLVTAVKAADLVETLKGPGPFTVFAPSDAAFAKLPAGALDGLLADKSALTSVLTFHVVPGRILSSDIAKKDGARTVNGQPLDIEMRNGKVYVNGAQVVSADIPASNGVIHVIDAVMLPSAAAAPAGR
jgi:uncharacterized surface protein with fasciclin (FAS1) repeats